MKLFGMKQIKNSHLKQFSFHKYYHQSPQFYIALQSSIFLGLFLQTCTLLCRLMLLPIILIRGNRLPCHPTELISVSWGLNAPCSPSEYYPYSVLDDARGAGWENRATHQKKNHHQECSRLVDRKQNVPRSKRQRNSIFIENSASGAKGLQKECQKVQSHRWRFLQQKHVKQEFLSKEVTGAFFFFKLMSVYIVQSV